MMKTTQLFIIIGLSTIVQSTILTEVEQCNAGYATKVTIRSRRRRSRKNIIECIECTPGTYSDGNALTNCHQCPSGLYQPASQASTCIGNHICPQGKHGTTGSITENSCNDCQPGQFQDLIGQNSCKKCEPGMFTNNINQNKCEGTRCSAGTVGLYGSTSITSTLCTDCDIGKYHNQTLDSCIKCPFGKWQSNKGQTNCLEMPGHKWGDCYIKTNDTTQPWTISDCLYTTWRNLAFYLSIPVPIQSLVTICYYENPVFIITFIYGIAVTCQVKKGEYVVEGAYIGITVISSLLIILFTYMYIKYLIKMYVTQQKSTVNVSNTETKSSQVVIEMNNNCYSSDSDSD